VTAGLSDRDYRSLAEFRHALRVFLRFSEDAARTAGLTPNQHQLLLAVRGAADGPPSIGDIAEALQLKHHSVVELVQRSEAAGLLIRRTDDLDARVHRVALTDLGEKRLADLSRPHRDELRRFRREMNAVLEELD
jgi:DNA-binding MarR family transcriptional regulator